MGWVCEFCSTNNDDLDTQCMVCDKAKGTTSVCTLTAKRVKNLGLSGDVVIPFEYNVIGEGAFLNRTDITSISLHSGVKKIAKEAFLGCTSLKYINAPTELDSIGAKAFYDCTALDKMYYPKAKKISDSAFGSTLEKTKARVDIPPERSPSSTASAYSPSSTVRVSDYSLMSTTRAPSKKISFTPEQTVACAILGVIALAIIVPIIMWITSSCGWIAWQWVIGIFGGVGLAFGVILLSRAFRYYFEPYSFDTIATLCLMVLNLIFLFIFKQDYIVICLLLCVTGIVGTISISRIAFNAYKNGWGALNVALSIANTIILIISSVLML